jgi:non-ribosomal peptide synthase protein (TIGR01720 family)
VAAEVRRKVLDGGEPVPLDRAVSAVRAAVAAHSGVQCHEVLLVRPGRLPKTTSGKPRRGECRDQWADGSLRRSALAGPAVAPTGHSGEDLLRLLQTEVAALLQVSDPDDVPVDLPLRDAGLDSLGMMDLAKRIEDRTGAHVPPANVSDGSTLRELATFVVRSSESAPAAPPEAPRPGDVPFSPAQVHALQLEHWDWWNRAVMLDVHRPLTPERLRRATSALVARHDALRLRFRREDGWFAQSYGDVDSSFAVESVTSGEALLNDQHHRLSVEHGPVLRLLLIETGSEQRLFIVLNHLVMDGVTLGILVDELDQLCRLDERGEPLLRARTSARFDEFTRWMTDFARGGAAADRDFWRAQLDVPPPTAYDSRVDLGLQEKDISTVRQYLTPDETRALRTVRMDGPDGRRSPIATTLLTALVRTAQRQWSCGRLTIRLSSSGRQAAVHGLDLSRTAGDMHCTFPLAFEDSSAQSPGETLTAVGERLTRVPSAGVSYEGLLYLNDDPAMLKGIADAPVPTIWFNFQGEAPTRSRSGLFSPRDVPLGDMWDPECRLKQPPLYLECSIVEGATRLDWYYSPRHLEWTGAEIDEWRARFADELRGLMTDRS